MGGLDSETFKILATLGILALGLGFLRILLRRIPRTIHHPFKHRTVSRPKRAARPYRADANRHPSWGGPSAPFRLRRFWVVDGDTIEDNATKTIYRVSNIDCPETDKRARCFRERDLGRRAKLEAIRLLKGATEITIHPTGRIDQYGRSIATIDIDGQDFGRMMIERGFALPWRGVREDWCGPRGGLEEIARTCSATFWCKTCGATASRSP